MNSVAEAVNTLISAANVAHEKGAYSLEESHYIYLAISFLKKVSNQEEQPAANNPTHVEQVSPEDVPQNSQEGEASYFGDPTSY